MIYKLFSSANIEFFLQITYTTSQKNHKMVLFFY